MRSWKIVVAGEGGQGVQALAQTLALAAYHGGLESLYIPNFGIEQRGGVSLAMVQLSAAPIGAPKFQIADLIVALSPRSYRRCFQHLGPETMVLYDSSLMEPPGWRTRWWACRPTIPLLPKLLPKGWGDTPAGRRARPRGGA